jgi:hypothetical protein
MNKTDMSKPDRVPLRASERPYVAFMRHLATDEPEPLPKPLDPQQRVVGDAVAALADVIDRLGRTEVDIIGHLPDTVRLKLSRLILTAAEAAEASHVALVNFERHGALTPPRDDRRTTNRRKRCKP